LRRCLFCALVPLQIGEHGMGNVSMIEQSHNVRSVFQKAVYSAITKDLSGQEGCLVEGTYLHVLPLLLLTEYQSERFF